MKYSKAGKIYAVLFAFLLTAFTVYALLDTFVIPRAYMKVEPVVTPAMKRLSAQADEESVQTVASDSLSESALVDPPESDPPVSNEEVTENSIEPDTLATEAFVDIDAQTDYIETEASDTSPDEGSTERYFDAYGITISIEEYREYDTTIYVADVRLEEGNSIWTAFANDVYGKNVTSTVSDIAAQHYAILAINGDYYGARNYGYVIRNGVLYRAEKDGFEDLVIYPDGSFEIINENDITAEELVDAGAYQVLAFGPSLVENGEATISEDDSAELIVTKNPRTAIGVVEKGHYLFVVCDGRTTESVGLTLYDLAYFMRSLGAQTAYNLDGGGSSTMVFNGEIINKPTTNGSVIGERKVSDIVYVG